VRPTDVRAPFLERDAAEIVVRDRDFGVSANGWRTGDA